MKDQHNQNPVPTDGKLEWQTPVLITLDRGPATGTLQANNEGPKRNIEPTESGTPGTGVGRGPEMTGPS